MRQTHLEWTAVPYTLFEEAYSITHDGSVYDFAPGIVTVTLPEAQEGATAAQVFEAMQVVLAHAAASGMTRKVGWRLDGPRIIISGSEGSRTVHQVVVADAVLVKEVEDILDVAPDGTIIYDSRRERIDHQRQLAKMLVEAQSIDPLCGYLVATLQLSRQQPDYELIHLYEIREALAKRLGGHQRAKEQLNCSDDDWSFLGKLTNDHPVEGSRHKGKHMAAATPLRQPTVEELTRARGIVDAMMEAFARIVIDA